VEALGLLTSDGEVRELTPGSSDGAFAATLGGMGLTGVIVWARLRLRRVSTALLSVDTDRVDGRCSRSASSARRPASMLIQRRRVA